MVNLFSYFGVFLLGLIAGSFLNCVIYRLENNRGFFWGRSFCPHCKHVLSWHDLIPILSFLWLGGRCHYCRKPISWQYPLIEISTALIFLAIFNFQFPIFYFLIFAFLIVIFVYDLKHYLIPDKIIYPAIGVTLVYNLLRPNLESGRFSLGVFGAAFGAAGFFLLIVLVSRGRWMGVGDIKLAFFMGLVLGWPNILVALFFAFFSGAIIGTGLVFAGEKSFKSEVPFGPFLVSGTLVAIFYGEELIKRYLGLYV